MKGLFFFTDFTVYHPFARPGQAKGGCRELAYCGTALKVDGRTLVAIRDTHSLWVDAYVDQHEELTLHGSMHEGPIHS